MNLSDIEACASCGVSLYSAAASVHRKVLLCPYCDGVVQHAQPQVATTTPSDSEQSALLAHFGENAPASSTQFAPARPTQSALHPVPMRPVAAKAPQEHWLDPNSSLTMTQLQHLATDDYRAAGAARLEARWLARRQHRRSERMMLNAACYVALVLIMGAVSFIQLEESTASERHAADQRYAEAHAELQERVQREQNQALFAARHALSQPSWMELLGCIQDSRQLLPVIRDHFDQWPYQPVSHPDLRVAKWVQGKLGVQVHLWLRTIAGDKPIVMTKVADRFKIDWEACHQSLVQRPVREKRPQHNLDLGARYFGGLSDRG